jgi:hypothetical protein
LETQVAPRAAALILVKPMVDKTARATMIVMTTNTSTSVRPFGASKAGFPVRCGIFML